MWERATLDGRFMQSNPPWGGIRPASKRQVTPTSRAKSKQSAVYGETLAFQPGVAKYRAIVISMSSPEVSGPDKPSGAAICLTLVKVHQPSQVLQCTSQGGSYIPPRATKKN